MDQLPVVYWLEQSESDVPRHDGWLTEREKLQLARLAVEKRRKDWRLGRWTAKRTFQAFQCLHGEICTPSQIEVRVRESGAPEICVENHSISISITHRNGLAMCALESNGGAIGCDLEALEPRSDTFVSDYFTNEEQVLISEAPPAAKDLTITLLWSAKESALKFLEAGLRMCTRAVNVNLGKGAVQFLASAPHRREMRGWHPLKIHIDIGDSLRGWWTLRGPMIQTIVASGHKLPVHLQS
ncbi:MAG: 4'-phosphopantetheinyl transferase family protein [Terriglobales bacterium]